MTPTALTPAGRGTRSPQRPDAPNRKSGGVRTGASSAAGAPRPAAAPAGGRGTGHRTAVRRSTAPQAPRRVSGPARAPRPTRPATGAAGAARARRQTTVRAPLPARCLAHLRALPDHALLDRIIRGRYWIPILGVLLVGIVAMQVEVLKLNAGIGHALAQSTSLQARNEQLRAAVAREADDQRIESMAAAMGMVMPQPAAIGFLDRHPTVGVGRAIANIHAPDPTAFAAPATAATIAAATSTGTGSAATGP